MNPQFKAWFGKSLVVDNNGNPLRVYHGSKADFSEFAHVKPAWMNNPKYGYFFTDSPDYAGKYSGTNDTGSNIMPVYLRLEHPISYDGFVKALRADKSLQASKFIQDLINQGYDGVITDQAHEFGLPHIKGTPKTFIVFSPNQIKSAIGNKGTYDPKSNHVNESAKVLPKINWNMRGTKGWNPEFICSDRIPLSSIGSSQRYRSNEVVNEYVEKILAGKPIDPIWVTPINEPNKYIIARGTFGGHHRMWALRKLGFTNQMIPVMVYDYPNRDYWNVKESTDYRQVSSEKARKSSEKVTESKESIKQELESLQFPLTIYRGIEVESLDSIDKSNLGLYWTTDRDAALAYWSEGESDPYIVTAKLSNKNNVDWYSTLKARLRYPDEKEITLLNDKDIEVVSITTESTKSNGLFSFMIESKAFRNEDMVEKYTVKELSEILFAMMLVLHLMSEREQAKKYCINTLRFPKFNHIFLSSTDLANVITTLNNARKYLNKPNVDLPINEMKRFLRGIVLNQNTPAFCRAFFMKLQTRLRIKDANLLILRRQIVDGDGHNRDDVSRGKPLYEYLRKYRDKSDMLALLQILVDGPLTESAEPKGDCFKDSFSVIASGIAPGMKQSLDDMENVRLVHGLVTLSDGRRGDHAWIEFSAGKYNFVWDPQAKRVINKDEFYKELDVEPLGSYSQPKALGNAIKFGHSGPWVVKEETKPLFSGII